MFEYHGWISVNADWGDDDDTGPLPENDPVIRDVLAWLREELATWPYLAQVAWTNGELHVHVGGFTNHRGTFGDHLENLFIEVGRRARGSYGLLHVHDDEDPDETRANEFVTFSLARGQFRRHRDVFLSPVIPTIEDAWVEPEDRV